MSHRPPARGERWSALRGALLVAALSCNVATLWLSSRPALADSCTMSELLVPSCGAWLGASTPSADGRYDYTAGLAEYESVAANVPDILHFYKRDGGSFPTPQEVAMSERSGKQDSLLYYNWKPSTELTWAQVAAGAADDNIRVVADGLRRYPGRLFLTIFHEPENDQGGVGSGRTAADYVAMYRHVVTMLRDQGVTNVVFVMNFIGFSTWATVADDFYPGDDVVDWVAYDPYAFAGQPTFSSLLNQPSGQQPGFYDWAVVHAPGKPIMLAEWGFDLASQPGAPEALDSAAGALASQFPMVKALVYWNDKALDRDFRLDQPTAVGAAYGTAYSRMANDPYFNSTQVGAVGSGTSPADAGAVVETQPVPAVVEPVPNAVGATAAPAATVTSVVAPIVAGGVEVPAPQREGDTRGTGSSWLVAIASAVLLGLVMVLVRRRQSLQGAAMPEWSFVDDDRAAHGHGVRRPDHVHGQVADPDASVRGRVVRDVAVSVHGDAADDEARAVQLTE
jgi:beta-mannanase